MNLLQLLAQPVPSASYFNPTLPKEAAASADILNTLAWCVSAAGVFGLMVVGMNMSLQLRRGDPGEGGEHFRGVFIIALACIVATTAGPLVSWLGDLTLQ
ncbi:hypothetical protein AB0O01_05760 [Streptomyces sp. NPDC093252]|uniref:hypothetical protein n=1 Tax=Streptomyces sp. NPDC093252 TaxID=3154980 RepID=UPI0034488793